jgi:asparagine synthase (glutamine-hydrolysing)
MKDGRLPTMSVQFGKFHFDGKPVDRRDLDQVRPVLAPYGPDGEGYICKHNLGILYRAFHTTKEAHYEIQPHVSTSGTVITWDGRLDNREQLVNELHGELPSTATDLEIVAAAYEHWRTGCFAKLIGDWALSIWDPNDCSIILAKDFIGTRHLYYSLEMEQLSWCTILAPLLLFAGHRLALEEEYIAGWLSFFPATHLTPYVGIHSVPPCSFVRLAKRAHGVTRYWDFEPNREIRYRTDSEYEEHFRAVITESVRRRLRSDKPVLAELSGGMDSSSIVCIADDIIACGQAETPRLDTLSYYDDSEPNWNERPYFAKVEEKRGRRGWHIDVSSDRPWNLTSEIRSFAATPGCIAGCGKVSDELRACLVSQGNRVVLSGIGGDEVTGGVPTPTQELADLVSTCSLTTFVHRLKLWALNHRKPWFHLFAETIRAFLPPSLVGSPAPRRPPSWLDPGFVKRNRAALRGYETRLKLFGPLPSFQDNIATLNALRRQLGCDCQPIGPLYEPRYPYLDRSLLEFLYAVPREQLVRPGQRRSLMRRSLSGIVPDELLNRKRKADVARAPMAALGDESADLIQMTDRMVSTRFGIVDAKGFADVIHRARDGHRVLMIFLIRTLNLESWLTTLLSQGLIHQRSPFLFHDPLARVAKHRVVQHF